MLRKYVKSAVQKDTISFWETCDTSSIPTHNGHLVAAGVDVTVI